jgi:dipeptidyl aminopeptidase/acylaminoacyl peptidase
MFHNLENSKKTAYLILGIAMLATLVLPTIPAAAGWTTLVGGLPAYTTIVKYQISPDSHYVVFTADVEVDNRYEIYSIPVAGGQPTRLNPPLVAGGKVREVSFEITPDSSRVIYLADQEVDERFELYSVPIGGGPATKLNGSLINGGDVATTFKIDSSSGRVVYLADEDTNDVFELYSVLETGSGFVKLNPTPAEGGDVLSFQIDPTSERVVYIAEQDNANLNELYSVPLSGGASVKLNQPLLTSIGDFSITPGIAYVVYIAKEVKASGTPAFELFGNDIPGGTPRRRSIDLQPGQNVVSYKIGPTASEVVYTISENNLVSAGNMWVTNPFAGTSQLLEGADPNFGVAPFDYRFTPDGGRIVFNYQKDAASPIKLQSISDSGVNLLDLYVPTNSHFVDFYIISPNGQRVLFQVGGLIPGSEELFAISPFGGSLVPYSFGQDPVITPDSQRVIYFYSPLASDRGDLLSVLISGGGLRNLSNVKSSEFATGPQVSPDGKWIVFLIQLVNGASELRISDGGESPPEPTPTPSPTPSPTADPGGPKIFLPVVVH